MSLLTASELHGLLPKAPSPRGLYDLGAGVTVALERATNRVFAKRVSEFSWADNVATLRVLRHGFRVGQEVRVLDTAGTNAWDGVFEVATMVDADRFTVALEAESQPVVIDELTVRPVREMVVPTEGGHDIFIHPRPVAELRSLEIGKREGGFNDPLESDRYLMPDLFEEVSVSGQVMLIGSRFPILRDGAIRTVPMPNGCRVKYVSGEIYPPADIIWACKEVLKEMGATKKNDKKSFSYDYYSYTRMSGTEMAELFGNVQSVIRNYRLAAV